MGAPPSSNVFPPPTLPVAQIVQPGTGQLTQEGFWFLYQLFIAAGKTNDVAVLEAFDSNEGGALEAATEARRSAAVNEGTYPPAHFDFLKRLIAAGAEPLYYRKAIEEVRKLAYLTTEPKRNLTELKSPLDYGAQGDGVHDDTVNVQLAVTKLGYLWLPAGKTFLTRKITITAAYAQVFGGGKIKAKNALNDDLLYFDGSANSSPGSFFRIEDIEIDGNLSGQSGGTGACIALRNSSYALVSRCYIHHSYGDGIRVENYNNLGNGDEVNIIDNRIFFNNRNGIFLEPTGGSSGHVGDHLIFANHINFNTGNGIRGIWLTSTIIGQNNVLTNASHGIYCTAADRCTFISNESRNNGGNGLFVDQDGTFGRSNDILCLGNGFHFNGSAASATYDEAGIWHTDRFQFLGNFCGDTDFTARCNYGLQITSDVTGAVVAHNIFNNLIAGAFLSNGAAYTAYGNSGGAVLLDRFTSLTCSARVFTGASDTLLQTDFQVEANISGAATETLLSAAAYPGAVSCIVNSSTSSANVTVTPAGGQTIGGNATVVLTPGQSIIIASVGTSNWNILAQSLSAGVLSINGLTGALTTTTVNPGTGYKLTIGSAGTTLTFTLAAPGAWLSFVPTVTGLNAGFTTDCAYLQEGKKITMRLSVTGTPAVAGVPPTFTLPQTAKSANQTFAVIGYFTVAAQWNGYSGCPMLSTTVCGPQGGLIAAVNTIFIVSGDYEAA